MPSTRIVTKRLVLARWTIEDAPDLRRVLDANQAHLAPWIPFMRQEPRTLAETRAWVAGFEALFDPGEAHRYAVRARHGGALVGEVMLMSRVGPAALEAGYWFARDAGGRGLATEAMEALLDAAFAEEGLERVELHCDPRNTASVALARRLGAAQETELRAEDGARLGVWIVRR